MAETLNGQEFSPLGFDQMRELDRQTNWSKKLHQDRFKFVEKYREILNEYFEED